VIHDPSEILSLSESTGFGTEMLEKVLHLLNLLKTLNSHPVLKGKWVLKGGTALNLFLFEIPRLSVDIDLNYIGAADRDEMLSDRPRIEQATQAVFSREGFTIKRAPDEHAGGKWRLGYQSFTGQPGNLEVDFNFMFRLPLWEVYNYDSCPLGEYQAKGIPVLDTHELAAGKLAALFARRQARDLFDCHQLLKMDGLDHERLRIAFVTYGGMNRKDWRDVLVEDVDFDETELTRMLYPMLNARLTQTQGASSDYGTLLLQECRERLSVLLPFTEAEHTFLDLLLDEGKIEASLLTDDECLQKRIQQQPLLNWKALNVKKHKGLL
jgi:predicted nucleotidyltransferase component of viral defense system